MNSPQYHRGHTPVFWLGLVYGMQKARMYYYPPTKNGQRTVVHTFPLSIGRMDWKSPLGVTKVIKKETDPPWRPTASIKSEAAAEGEVLPDVVPGGAPNNPLGRFALRLAKAGYLIHGATASRHSG